MKIVRIIARLNVGGPARHVVWLNQALSDDEYDSVLLTGMVPDGEEDMSYFAEECGVKPVLIEEMSRELSPKDLISLWKIYKHICREKPDIIHTHTAKAGTIGRVAGFLFRWATPKTLIGRPRKVKILHTFHGHVFHSYYGKLKTSVFLGIERVLARLVTDKIVVISRQQSREINGAFKIGKKEQFEIIRLGLDLRPFEESRNQKEVIRKEIGVSDKEVLVGLVGRLTEVKNHELLLDVASRIKADGNGSIPSFRFVIIGDGHRRGYLEQQVKDRNLSDIVKFLGNRDDPGTFYAGLDILALTSLNEGTPLSLIEAMASEKPIISTNVGGVTDLLGEVETKREEFSIHERGISVATGDVSAFYEGLKHLASDSKLQLELTMNGKEFVLENYSKSRLIQDIKGLYERVISS